MALLNEVIFAVCLVALGFGPILYSAKVLRNDPSLYDLRSALYGQRSQQSIPGVPFGFVESSTTQSAIISGSETLVDSSVSTEDPTSTYFSTYEHASGDINQHDTLAQKSVLSNTEPFHAMKMPDLTIPLLSEATEVHTLAHLLHSNNIVSPDATATDIGTRASLRNAHTQRTSDQAVLRSIACSYVKATPSASLPEMTNSPTANAEALNSQAEVFLSTEPLHRRSPAQGSSTRKSIAKTALEVMQASVLILVGIFIGMSSSYFSTLPSRLRDHIKFRKDSAVQEGLESTSSQPSDECNVEVLIKHDGLVHPGTLQVSSYPQTLSNAPSLLPSPVIHFVVDNCEEEAEDYLFQCKDEAADPPVASDEGDVDTHGFSRLDVEASSLNTFSMHSESGDQMAVQFREEAVVFADEPDQESAVSDVPSQVDEVNDFAVQIDEVVSESIDQCAEVINPVIYTAPPLSDITLPSLNGGSSHSALSADASGAEGTMTNPLSEEITHFFMNSRYVPPHKRALDPQGKEHLPRKVVIVPSGCSLLEPEPLPKARQFQYDFFKGFLENFRRGTGASNSTSNAADGPVTGCEHDWRHRESKPVLSGRWHFSRLTARLNRVIEEDKDDEACGESRPQNVADTEHCDLGRIASTLSCDNSLDGSISESISSDPSCPLTEGSLSGNRFRVLSMTGCSASGELEKKTNPTPLQIAPSRVLLLHDDSKPKIRSYSDRDTYKELIEGEKERGRALELRELMRSRGGVNQTDESGDF